MEKATLETKKKLKDKGNRDAIEPLFQSSPFFGAQRLLQITF